MSSISSKPLESLGGLREASSLPPSPRAPSPQPGPIFQLCRASLSLDARCPSLSTARREWGQKGEQESPGFRGARSRSPGACGGLEGPRRFPSPCAAEAPDAAVLLPRAAAAAAARSLVERVSGCKLRQTSLHPPPGRIPSKYQPESAPSPGHPAAASYKGTRSLFPSLPLPTPFLSQCREGLREFPPKL